MYLLVEHNDAIRLVRQSFIAWQL